jgi:hypothetical protein
VIKLKLNDPVHLGIAGTAAYTTWTAMGYPTSPHALAAVASSFVAGISSSTVKSSNPNVSADSHIVTPYVNNIEE